MVGVLLDPECPSPRWGWASSDPALPWSGAATRAKLFAGQGTGLKAANRSALRDVVLRTGFEPPNGRPLVLLDGLGAAPLGPGEQEEALDGLRQLALVLAQLTPPSLRDGVTAAWRQALLDVAERQLATEQAAMATVLRLCAAEALPDPEDPPESPADIAWLVDGGRSERLKAWA